MRSLFVLWSLAVFSSLVFTNNGFEEGHAAYEEQEYAKAFEILRPLAEGGNADTQNILGTMYNLYDERIRTALWVHKVMSAHLNRSFTTFGGQSRLQNKKRSRI